MNKEQLHRIEMELVASCENPDVDRMMMKEVIITKFTNLISEAKD